MDMTDMAPPDTAFKNGAFVSSEKAPSMLAVVLVYSRRMSMLDENVGIVDDQVGLIQVWHLLAQQQVL